MSAPKMEAPKEPLPAHTTSPNASDWELPQEGTSKPTRRWLGTTALGWTIADRFDRVLPPHKRYLGRSRRTFVIALVALLLILLALVVGLAVGLTNKSGPRNLPLPSGAETYTGDLTYYDPALGACGIESSASQDVVAVSHFTFDAVQVGGNPNTNVLCGKKIRAQRKYNGETVSVDLTVVDRCTGCKATDIDVSPSAFDKLAHRDLGRVPVTWAWLEQDS
ncbi:hypothetical protein M011DRAFT_466567 [Sporormia fimetaria CBS 119925]|uniref:RlpA-like protein double-psi beta-barrel domain-containing protein n=1 Tax=Sporormia fimetaria CBS 119925 TaxID=1340428 RepID=A0A6A6VE09_9PLEO|nr:hypothetical protein M011DRAFT_466567 [Sporormia fimetaria CBS 119925]